jgi:hypothetical protein
MNAFTKSLYHSLVVKVLALRLRALRLLGLKLVEFTPPLTPCQDLFLPFSSHSLSICSVVSNTDNSLAASLRLRAT